MTSWEGYDLTQEVLGAEADKGDVLIVKSGTDFRDLSEFTLELEDTPPGSTRKKVIKSITGQYHPRFSFPKTHLCILGRRHTTRPGSLVSKKLAKLLEKLLSGVSSTLKYPVCKTEVEIDCRSQIIRTAEVYCPIITYSRVLTSRSLQQAIGLQTYFDIPTIMLSA